MNTAYGVGIDIGSTCAKTVVVDTDKNIVWRDLRPTGWSSVDTAEAIRRELPEAASGAEAGTTVSECTIAASK